MKIHILPFVVLLIFTGATVNAQNVYSKDSERVISKVLGTDSIHSNLSLMENLSEIPSFSRQLQVFQYTDFEKMIEQHQMVTVFVVRNNAFDTLDKEELEEFLSISNKVELSSLQSYYIIPGRVDEHAIRKAVTDGGGAASFRTLGDKNVRFQTEGERIFLYTDNGSRSKLAETNFYHNKGLFHVTDNFPIQKK